MDYASEQQMELEALEAIFMDELQEFIGTLPDKWNAVGNTYKMVVDPLEQGEEPTGDSDEKIMELIWAHTANYPDEGPLYKVRAVRGLSDRDIEEANGVVRQQVEENLGMSMIYTILTGLKEWLRNKADESEEVDPEIARKRAEDAEEARRAAARAHGTPVTVETFAAWKAKFEAEMAALKNQDATKDEEKAKKLSGKQWFLQDKQSEVATDAGAISDDDEDDFDVDEDDLIGDDEDELDYEDDDDEGFLEDLVEEEEEDD